MKALVFSDSHGSIGKVIDMINLHKNIDYIFHLGDVVGDAEDLQSIFPGIKHVYVKGNCDFYDTVANEIEIVEIEGKKILLTHGHLFHVKYGNEEICQFGVDNNIDLILFGHTHIPFTDEFEGIYVMNPGSASGIRTPYGATFGIVEIDKLKKMHVTLGDL